MCRPRAGALVLQGGQELSDSQGTMLALAWSVIASYISTQQKVLTRALMGL